jgi:hypothetical protein
MAEVSLENPLIFSTDLVFFIFFYFSSECPEIYDRFYILKSKFEIILLYYETFRVLFYTFGASTGLKVCPNAIVKFEPHAT